MLEVSWLVINFINSQQGFFILPLLAIYFLSLPYFSLLFFYIIFTLFLATYFMTYHTIMTENEDYIGGLKMARKIADNITTTMRGMLHDDSIKVFPYR